MYKLASWNIRGLNNPYKKSEVLGWIKKNKLDLVALLEVKLHENKWCDAISKCRPDELWKADFSSIDGGWARIMLLRNGVTTRISNIVKNDYFMSCEVDVEEKKFGLIVVYASNNNRDRIRTWIDIEQAASKFNVPWICIGDFNCVKDQKDKLNGKRVRESDMLDFRNFLTRSGLQDLPASGYHFTWSNNHDVNVDRIWCKLDRALGNDLWFKKMEDAQALFLPPGISDHSPVIVHWGDEKRLVRNFRYCNFWEHLDDYNEAIRRTWNTGNKCKNLFMLQTKLQMMKKMLKQNFVGRTRGMDERMNTARAALMDPQINSESNPNDSELCALERKLALDFRKIKYNQFLFNKQRTNAQWIKEGDANTKFFHSLLKTRRNRNSINQITLQDGSTSTDIDIIKHEFSVYFRDLLGRAKDCCPVDADVVAQGPAVTEEQCRMLVRAVNDKEIWLVLSSMGNDKAPGPDGFSASFFKKNWSIIGKELCEGVRHCLRHNAMPKGVNAAYIALIPKSSQASKPEDYRPISCYNITYKIVASLIAGRLKEVLPFIINQAQGAFVKDQSIVDNICLAQQLFNGYGRRNISE
ncbi:hypothetical protein QQ045_011172 [Rhodiola kirilowii]